MLTLKLGVIFHFYSIGLSNNFVRICNLNQAAPCPREAEKSRPISGFEASQGYMEKLCLEKTK